MPLAVGPSGPTESSTAVPAGGFSTWFKNIIDWIKALSPSGASQYDTGWVNLTLNSGFVTGVWTPQVRRIGKTVYYQGEVSPASGSFPSGLSVVATVGAEFRPTSFRNAASALWPNPTLPGPVFGTVSSSIEIRVPPAITGATVISLKGLSGYQVD